MSEEGSKDDLDAEASWAALLGRFPEASVGATKSSVPEEGRRLLLAFLMIEDVYIRGAIVNLVERIGNSVRETARES